MSLRSLTRPLAVGVATCGAIALTVLAAIVSWRAGDRASAAPLSLGDADARDDRCDVLGRDGRNRNEALFVGCGGYLE